MHRLAALTLLAALPLAAAQEDPWAEVDPSGQTVTFWHQHSGEREEALNDLIADFNETNAYGITVEPLYQGSYGDIFNQMLVRLGTPDVPDLVVAYQNQAATYALADGLIDMNSLVESPTWGFSEEEVADFFPGFWEQDVFPTFGGARFGLPPNRSLEVMYYNADWLAELGYDGPPETPEAFREIACAAAETPFSGATGSGSLGYQLSLDASRFASFTFAFGGDIYDDESNRYTYDDPAAVEAMTFLQELIQDGCASTVTERFGDQTDFGAGTLMFTVGSSSGLPFYASAVSEGAGHDWSVAAIPHVTPEPVMNLYGASVSMPDTGSLERQLATWVFLKYYTSPDVQAEWALRSNYFPARISAAESELIQQEFENNPTYETAFNLLQYATAEPPTPGYDFVRDLVATAMAEIAAGADVESTLTALNEEANAILDEQLAEMAAAQ
ncbi:ABC transporter substrate-binding protein [Truepera radiovictrix]|uniref:Extracellular solute-binding protein family 1 n=1 Tax=Truepera radiovictrix (strain DSM 17093 / CIP 108686 / LMG 22925 / RQ-24) TaxID=649638 RepID=D7CSH2_TRURR|nr:ABC transporter substrate-binding protein [Truepera radiovictrix]ADI15392.1 extracellular solute-binding protein family 1 [Truepera radiovictrix DSM 17093]WMT56057.1 ABC transporter substrate-binding protein [Truepera radiovictrix]